MLSVIDRFDWIRIAKWIGIPAAIYGSVAYMTDAEKLNPTEILVLISLSAAVCVAFLPQFFRFFLRGEPVTPVGVACLGIFTGWVSNIIRPAIPFAIELFPNLAWIRDSDVASAGFAVAIYAGLCHLLAPAVTEFGEIPPRKWAKVGAYAGIGLFAALVILYWPRVSAIWEGRRPDQVSSAPWRIPGSKDYVAVVPSDRQAILGRESGEDFALDGPGAAPERKSRSVAAGVTGTMWDRVERHRIAQGERSTAAAVRDLLGHALDDEDRADVQAPPKR